MKSYRVVTGSQSMFFPAGAAFTVPGNGVSGVGAKPGATDPAWILLGPVKWSKKPTSKTEEWMTPAPGAYQAQDEVTISRGLKLTGKLEAQSNLAVQLALAAAPNAGGNLPASPAAGGQFNPLAGDPVMRGWLHVQEYDQNNVLLNTVDYYVAMKASGDTNNDDKPTETPVEVTVLFSTLSSGNLS